MKHFLYKLCIYSLLPTMFIILLVIVDPLDYFGLSHVISTTKKSQVKEHFAGRDMIKNGTLKMSDFRHKQYDNILIGDSRVIPIDTSYLYKLTGDRWFNFALQGSGIRSCCSCFWWIIRHGHTPNIVYFGLNFWNSNSPDYFAEIDDVCSSVSTYILSKTVLKLTFNDIFQHKKQYVSTDTITWNDVLDWKKESVSDIKSLDKDVLHCLEEVFEYCQSHHIRIVFVLPPEHKDIMKIIQQSQKAMQCYNTYIEYFSKYEFYNFNIPQWTDSKENFSDPMHPHAFVYYSLCDSIFCK